MTHPGGQGRRSAAPRAAAVCALLVLATVLVFGRTAGHEFVNYDDDEYVYDNPRVMGGPTAAGVAWAFTQRHADNWHPLTWLSHMLDSRLFGLNAGGHHLTSVLLHAVTAALLFLALRQATGRTGAAALAAALFAVHPLRVESVAWVAERKDVLSGLFFVLTLAAHVRRARRPAAPCASLAVFAACALGLLAKPMLVTVPLVLLLLDSWPLGRTRQRSFAALALEKAPLLALAAASGAVTLWAQRHALLPGEGPPLAWRAGNAAVAYVAYVGKMLLPANLAVFYPPRALSAGAVAAAGAALAGVTAAAFARRREHPYLLAGWLWYAAMLLPVIGLVRIGGQALADRYTYLPQIGLAVAAAWGGAAACRTVRLRRLAPVAAGLAVALLSAIAWRQAGHWRTSETLFTHALAVTSGNHVAHNNLGLALAGRGRVEEAIAHFRRAREIDPAFGEAAINLGNVLAGRGRPDEAIAQYRAALEADPDNALAHYNLGNALTGRGRLEEAAARYRRALELRPGYAKARYNLGNVLAAGGRLDEAIAEYTRALEVAPGAPETHNNLGNALAGRGRHDEAAAHYRRAVALDPAYGEAHANLGDLLAGRGRHAEAAASWRTALALAERQGKRALAEALRGRLARYETPAAPPL